MAIVLSIKVKPSSGQQKIVLDKSGVIVCYLKSAPEDGKANHELIKFLSKKLDLIQQEISIIYGLTSRNKKISIRSEDSKDAIYRKLDLPIQQSCD